MEKIKILYSGMSSNYGGIEKFLMNLYKNLDKEKFEISFLIFKGKKVCFQDELEKDGVKFFEITHRTRNYFRFLKNLKKIFKSNDFDVIHFNIMNFSCFERIVLAKKYSKARIIVHSHSSKPNKQYRKMILLDKIGRFFVRNIEYEKIACGQEAGEWLFGKEKFLVLNNGMEVEKFQFNKENRKSIREEFAIDEDAKVLGHVGAMYPVKNHEFLIQVFCEYQKLEKHSKLILVGNGELKNTLLQQVEKAKIQDKVLFLGNRDDVEKIYSAMDIFVMPSWFEGFSIAIMEAQINGLKCYTSSRVAKESNVTGNVEFLDLEKQAEYWAKKIYEGNNLRDEKVIEKVPNKFKIEESVKVLSKIYGEKDKK